MACQWARDVTPKGQVGTKKQPPGRTKELTITSRNSCATSAKSLGLRLIGAINSRHNHRTGRSNCKNRRPSRYGCPLVCIDFYLNNARRDHEFHRPISWLCFEIVAGSRGRSSWGGLLPRVRAGRRGNVANLCDPTICQVLRSLIASVCPVSSGGWALHVVTADTSPPCC